MKFRAFGRAATFGCLLALASVTNAEAASSGRLVEIHVYGDAPATEHVRTVATELFSGISMAPVVIAGDASSPRYASPAEPFVRAYFDLRSTPASLVIVDGSTSRELERRSLPEHAELEAAVESATHVLLMVVESMLDERAAEEATHAATAPTPSSTHGVDVAPEAAVAAPQRANEAEPARGAPEHAHAASGPLLEMGLLGRALYLGEDRLLPGAGAGVDFRIDRAHPLLGISTSFAAHSSMTLALGGATAKLYPMSLYLVPTLQAGIESSTSALFGAGLGLTWFSLHAEGPPGVLLGQSAGGVDPTLVGVVGLRVRLSSRFSLTTTAGLEYDPTPTEFVAVEGDQRHVLAALPALRPSVSVLGAYSLLGPTVSKRTPEGE